MTSADGPSYAPLVLGAANAAALLFAAQGVAAIAVADQMGASTRVGVAAVVIPYAQIDATPETFVSIVGWSSLVAVTVLCLGVVRSLVRHRDEPLRIDGWSAGLLMALMLIGSHALRQLTGGSQVDMADLKPLVISFVLIVATGLAVVAARPLRTWRPPSPSSIPTDPQVLTSGLQNPRLPKRHSEQRRSTVAGQRRTDTREVVHQ